MGRKIGIMVAVLGCLILVAQCAASKGKGPKKEYYRVGLVQFSQDPALERARQGLIQVLEQEGAGQGFKVALEWASAGGQRLAIRSILKDFQDRGFDLVVTLSSPCLEEAVRVLHGVPVVFGVSINPRVLGLGTNRGRLQNFTGLYAEPPLEELGQLLQGILPGIHTVGVIWNPSEINSRYEMLALRKACRRRNYVIVEERLRNKSQLLLKTHTLIGLAPQVIILLADNTVVSGFSSIAEVIRQSGIPLVTDMNYLVRQGALLGLGFDFYSWGQATGRMVLKVLEGTPPGDIPMEEFRDLKLALNLNSARQLGLEIPQHILQRADEVIR